jgi:NifB/MoaA-like Fe-S oxidoreductase
MYLTKFSVEPGCDQLLRLGWKPMAIPALKIEPEAPLEERFARLEVNVEHIQKDVSDMKVDILTAKIDAFEQRLTGKIDSLKDVVTALAINMEKQFGALRTARAFDRVWWLLMSAAILSIMGRAFKWF